jgi:uncharacterized protein DUF2019
MTPINLHEMTTQQLVQQFVVLSLEQDRTLTRDDVEGYNRLFDVLEAVKQELQRRPDDQRQALLPLYDHPNAQVRLNAAMGTLQVAPKAARRMLEIIRHSREYPQAADAGMTIHALDGDVFKPTRKT